MTSSKDTFSNRPFEKLDRLLKRKAVTPLPSRLPSKTTPAASKASSCDAKSDRELFLDAVRDVAPIKKQIHSMSSRSPVSVKRRPGESEHEEAYRKLKRLVTSGEGFVISQTPEYMEGTGHHVSSGITHHLHHGRFSIQDHIDLHGLDAVTAIDAIECFLKRAISDDLRSLLIIHGRGLSSSGEPVLKTKLQQLLVSNRWRKWILAFTSARSCDGGTGATYVLLRNKPLSKKKLKIEENSEAGKHGAE